MSRVIQRKFRQAIVLKELSKRDSDPESLEYSSPFAATEGSNHECVAGSDDNARNKFRSDAKQKLLKYSSDIDKERSIEQDGQTSIV